MPFDPPSSSSSHPNQKVSIGRLNSLKTSCEQCRHHRRVCNSQRPCSHCIQANQDCVYSNVASEHSRGVFTTQAARRLSSGSACETCRRRKTKCDGGSPCHFCATNHVECVNHSADKRHGNKLNHAKVPGEAMDRIEDRLRRIERLMTAFTPSPLSTHHEAGGGGSSSSGNGSGGSHKVRAYRHSVQGINAAKEQLEINSKYDIKRRGSPYTPPTRYTSLSPPPTSTPVSIMRPSNSQTSIAHSMLNLSISPSSSGINAFPLASTSSPSAPTLPLWPAASAPCSSFSSSGKRHELERNLLEQKQYLSSPPSSAHSAASASSSSSSSAASLGRQQDEWKTLGTIPSVMDQLSKRTFTTSAMDYTTSNYPIYPLTPPHNQSSCPSQRPHSQS